MADSKRCVLLPLTLVVSGNHPIESVVNLEVTPCICDQCKWEINPPMFTAQGISTKLRRDTLGSTEP